MKPIFAVLVTILTLQVNAQQKPQIFEPKTISDNGAFGLTISPDSKTALWVLSKGKRDTLKIMESVIQNGQWTKPRVASFSSPTGQWKDIDPMFSPDGKLLLFQSNRNSGRSSQRNDFDIWAVKRTDSGWGEPYRIAGSINSEASESYASMTNDGTIYFMKENDDKVGLSDIYYSEFKNGEYQEPENVGFPINTNQRESNPFIAPDGKYIIYFSSDKNGFGEVDLYISFKKKNKWTTPKNLGNPINSNVAEFCPFIHQQEKRLYFTRQEKQGDRFNENLYFIDFDINKYK